MRKPMNEDPQLWKHADHRARAEKLYAEGKPLSPHFKRMYVHDQIWYGPVHVGEHVIWQVIWSTWSTSWDIDLAEPRRAWRRRLP